MLTRHKRKLILLATLALASAVCLSLYLARAVYTRTLVYFFLNWNLFLAWIPLFWAFAAHSFYIRRSALSYLAMSVCAVFWLLFFPNAPYVLTDLMHLRALQNVPEWFDLIMLLAYALNSLVLGFVSLFLMQGLVKQMLGRWVGWLFVVGALSLGSFGIYLGRFLRWNSWDVVTDPLALFADVWPHLRYPLEHPRTLVFSILFAALSLSVYLSLVAFSHLQSETSPVH